MTTQTFKIKGIFITIYKSDKPKSRLIIYGIGAPTIPDNGNLPDAELILSAGADVVVPDYIGFGRSRGIFSPANCIKTFLLVHEYFKNKYSEIIIAGRSLGGTYVPLLPKYNPQISKLILIYPAVNQSTQGSFLGEESNKWFVDTLVSGFYGNYHSASRKIWNKHVLENDNFSPMKNIEFLSNSQVFIGHGKKDECINYLKTVNYWKKLTSQFPQNKSNYKLKIFPNGDHGPSTSIQTFSDAFVWYGWM